VFTRFKKCHVCRAKRKRPVIVRREDDVEAAYVKAREAEGKLVLKVKVLGRPGYPDRWVLGSIKAAARVYTDYNWGTGCRISEPDIRLVERIVAAAIQFTELKKTAKSRYQPRQKRIIPMLRKRGFKVDIVHG
jgi:hypothetical protein